jgi:transposase
LIGDFEGFFQSDGYEVYDLVSRERPALTHVGCMAHVRRDFFDAKKSSKKAGSADEALAMIATLYAAEHRRANHPDPQEFLSWRRTTVAPVLDKFHAWLQRKNAQVPPKLLLGQAVGYALGQWPKLVRYLEHPDLTPDNNACERAVRPFVLGRKNWLFSGSPRGAEASATLYTLVETAKANGREPYFYLRKLFTELPLAKSEQDLHPLLLFSDNWNSRVTTIRIPGSSRGPRSSRMCRREGILGGQRQPSEEAEKAHAGRRQAVGQRGQGRDGREDSAEVLGRREIAE